MNTLGKLAVPVHHSSSQPQWALTRQPNLCPTFGHHRLLAWLTKNNLSSRRTVTYVLIKHFSSQLVVLQPWTEVSQRLSLEVGTFIQKYSQYVSWDHIQFKLYNLWPAHQVCLSLKEKNNNNLKLQQGEFMKHMHVPKTSKSITAIYKNESILKLNEDEA